MITADTAKTMSWNALLYARKDLTEVVAVQDESERLHPGSCQKLSQYYDELLAVAQEMRSRHASRSYGPRGQRPPNDGDQDE